MRTCGSCFACCTTLAIPAINKPAFEKCPHAGVGGCAIYATRPPECQAFKCGWLGDEWFLRLMHRPDRSGLLFDQSTKDDADIYKTIPRERVVIAYELWDGVARDAEAQKLLHRIAKQMVVFVVGGKAETRRVMAPSDLMPKVKSFLKRQQGG